jgi:hypothetical protein
MAEELLRLEASPGRSASSDAESPGRTRRSSDRSVGVAWESNAYRPVDSFQCWVVPTSIQSSITFNPAAGGPTADALVFGGALAGEALVPTADRASAVPTRNAATDCVALLAGSRTGERPVAQDRNSSAMHTVIHTHEIHAMMRAHRNNQSVTRRGSTGACTDAARATPR